MRPGVNSPNNPRRLTAKELQDSIDEARAEIDRRTSQNVAKRVKTLETELAKAQAQLSNNTSTSIPGTQTEQQSHDNVQLHDNVKEFTHILQSIYRPSHTRTIAPPTTTVPTAEPPDTHTTPETASGMTNQVLPDITMARTELGFIRTDEMLTELPFYSDSEL